MQETTFDKVGPEQPFKLHPKGPTWVRYGTGMTLLGEGENAYLPVRQNPGRGSLGPAESIVVYVEQTERRQSGPEYREMVGRAVQSFVVTYGHDYDRAIEVMTPFPEITGSDESQFWRDVLSLLRRRAETVKGMRA